MHFLTIEKTMWLLNSILYWRIGWSLYKIHYIKDVWSYITWTPYAAYTWCLEESSLPVEKFSNISRDGPNITKSLHKKLDSKLKESYLHAGLLSFNSCNLCKCLNAFHKGITIYGKNQRIWPLSYMLGVRFHLLNDRTSIKLPSNCKAWSIFPRTKHFSTAMLKHNGWHWSQPWRRF